MKLWNIDLTTEDGAFAAAQLGSYACFVAAVLGASQLYMASRLVQAGAITPLAGIVLLVEILIFAGAGFRLRGGKGAVIGIVAALVLGIEALTKLLLLALPGLLIDAILLIVLINGIRGAFALRAGRFDDGAAAEEIFR